MFPWHSDALTSAIVPDTDVIKQFVWDPIAELDVNLVFAFGAPWSRLADALGLKEQQISVALSVPSRRVRVFELPSGQRLAVSWQAGYNGPPGESDVTTLRATLMG